MPNRPPRKSADHSRPPGRRNTRFPRGIHILYQDAATIVIDKPPGLASVPVKGLSTPSALEVLRTELPPPARVFVVHRIDRFTSGAILFAATPEDREVLIKQFLAHLPVRQYLAVVRGHLGAPEGTLVHYLRRDGMVQNVSAQSDPRATRAELRYRVERVLNGASLVRVELVTGLQNQIRVQFAADGHAVIGDRKYAPKEAAEKLIDRVALHAAHLAFTHPRTGKTIAVDCDPPADFKRLLQALRVSSGKR
jgi:RluA family pseudouridine synthase